MSFSTGFRKCKKCGKTLFGLFDGELCDKCEKAEQEPCDDAISRQAVLGELTFIGGEINPDDLTLIFRDRIKQLPPVQPKRQPGEWIKHKDGYFRCSRCGSRGSAIKAHYCHHCGADMRGSERRRFNVKTSEGNLRGQG